MALDSYGQSVQAAHSCSTGINWGASPTAAPIPSAHSAEEQEAWLPPVAVVGEVADILTAAAAGAERGLAMGPTVPDGTSGERCSKIPLSASFSSFPPYEPSGHPPE